MKRAIVFGLGALGAAAAAIPVVVSAQGFPPPPPTTYYGSVPSGIVAGQGVVAIVMDGGNSTACGSGTTLTDPASGKVVYVVDVVADGQTTGCGKSGRTVSFYFTSPSGGRISLDTPASWTTTPTNVDVKTVSAPLGRRGSAPQVAKDGSY